jgi:hypothetical protein
MADPVAFCPACGQPTKHATDADRLDFDLKQWRAHIERGDSNGGTGRAAVPASRIGVATSVRGGRFVTPPAKPRRRFTFPRIHLPAWRLPAVRRKEADRVIVLDHDDPSEYRACVTCGARDWILRGRRSGDRRWTYWCVRCSRSFRTSVRLPYGSKPFVASAGVLFLFFGLILVLR